MSLTNTLLVVIYWYEFKDRYEEIGTTFLVIIIFVILPLFFLLRAFWRALRKASASLGAAKIRLTGFLKKTCQGYRDCWWDLCYLERRES